MNVVPEDLLVHFVDRDDFCHPEWPAIFEKVKALELNDEQRKVFYRELVLVWLNRIKEKMAGYEITESENFFLLLNSAAKPVPELLSFLEKTRVTIHQSLRDMVQTTEPGKHVILLFDAEEDYYRYLAPFYPEGDFPLSVGVILDQGGYSHVLLHYIDGAVWGSLAYLYAKNCLHSLLLPDWLGIGLGKFFEGLLLPHVKTRFLGRIERFKISVEECEQHDAYWNEDTIQDFWAGRCWEGLDESGKLSYQLAEIIMNKITGTIRPSPDSLRAFIKEAGQEDSGEAAAQTYLKISLGDLVADFLGEGDWAPHPDRWVVNEESVKAEGDSA